MTARMDATMMTATPTDAPTAANGPPSPLPPSLRLSGSPLSTLSVPPPLLSSPPLSPAIKGILETNLTSANAKF